MTVAALASALAMLTSISIMIYSFRRTVNRWLERRLVADLFIAPAANEIVGLENFIPHTLIEFVNSLPEVETIDTYRGLTVSTGRDELWLGVGTLGALHRRPGTRLAYAFAGSDKPGVVEQ